MRETTGGTDMRKLSVLIVVLLSACTASEEEVMTTSVDVDQSKLPALLRDVDALADNSLPVGKILELAETTPMDDELQDRYAFEYEGVDEEIQIHVWREQVDWVHLYFSSTSKDLVAAIEETIEPFARPE